MKHPTATVSEQVNRKCISENTTVQLSIAFTNPALSNSHPQNFKIYMSGLAVVNMLSIAGPGNGL